MTLSKLFKTGDRTTKRMSPLDGDRVLVNSEAKAERSDYLSKEDERALLNHIEGDFDQTVNSFAKLAILLAEQNGSLDTED